MSNAALIKNLQRKTLELPAATRDARAAGSIKPDETITVTIRKVKANEVTSLVGTPPSVFRLALLQEGKEGETEEMRRQRVQQALSDDPNLMLDSQRQTIDTQRAVVALGVTSETVVLEGTPKDDELRPEDFGDDFQHLYDEIVNWSSLPFQRLGGAGIARFPEEPVGDSREPDGEVLRHDPEQPVGPAVG